MAGPPNRLRQGYGGPPKLHAKAEGGHDQRQRLVAVVAVALAGLLFATSRGEAHKPITSKYTYNEDVFPILQARCGRCHVAGGIAPMSLMTYNDARPWAESIHAELVAGHMPPGNADIGDFKNVHSLSARDFDVLLTWAVGGNPVGDLTRTPPPVSLPNQWPLGPPDLTLPLPEEFALPADKPEDTHEFLLAAAAAEGQWVRAVDLLPGTASLVRSAVIAVKRASTAEAGSQGIGPEDVLGVWAPGQDPVPTDDGTAFRIPMGGKIAVRVHYKKTWMDQGKAMSDRSTVGVYFAAPPVMELRALALTSPPLKADTDRKVSFGYTVDEDLHGVALRPDETMANIALHVDAVQPNGARDPMARLNVRADWAQRYWFAQPVALPRGTRIEVVATLGEPDALIPPAATAAPVKPADGSPVRLTLNVVPVPARSAAR